MTAAAAATSEVLGNEAAYASLHSSRGAAAAAAAVGSSDGYNEYSACSGAAGQVRDEGLGSALPPASRSISSATGGGGGGGDGSGSLRLSLSLNRSKSGILPPSGTASGSGAAAAPSSESEPTFSIGNIPKGAPGKAAEKRFKFTFS